MFDAFIIQRIRDEEENRRRESERPRLEIPYPEPAFEEAGDRETEVSERGVVIVGDENDD